MDYFRNSNWECWLYRTMKNLPHSASVSDAIKVEETLKKLYKELTGQEYK